MGQLKKLYQKAKEAPTNLKYTQLCTLAEKVGFVFRRQNGTSHKIYKHPDFPGSLMNFQKDKRDPSKAKDYQVEQLINFIDQHNLVDD